MREINDKMFKKVVQAFEAYDASVGSGGLYAEAVLYIDLGLPQVARAILAAASDMHNEDNSFINGERTYNEIFLETFRRAFFDAETAQQYGMSHVEQNVDGLLALITAHLLNRAMSGHSPKEDEPEAVTVGGNVYRFPGSKSIN